MKTQSQKKKRRRRPALRALREDTPYVVLALPGIVALVAFSYIPMTGLIMVFKDYHFSGGIYGSPWADPIYKNFLFFFNNFDTSMRATRNTVLFNFAFFVFGTIFAVAIAIMLHEVSNTRFVKISQSIMFFPYFISWMVIGSILQALISNETGILNNLILAATGSKFDFYGTPWAWVPILIIVNVWRSAGYTSVIYYAVITNFDTAMYEAAQIDGASRWQQITHLTLPLVRPTVTILFLLSVGGALKGGLDMIMGLTNLNPLLFPVTDLIDVYVYRSGVRNGEMAFASAISLYQSVFGFALVLISNKLAKMYDPETSLF